MSAARRAAPAPAGAGDPGPLPPWAYAAALAGLPFVDWRDLSGLLAGASPEEAWERVAAGGARPSWVGAAAGVSVPAVAAAHRQAGVTVDLLGQPGYPEVLAADHQAPAVLFRQGPPAAIAALTGPRVAIVGTRRATGYGRDVARRLGRELAESGVVVVSGLALGIDGAAHEGALQAVASPAAGVAPPVAVVGSGLDVVYPRRHAGLWRQVAAAGVLLSEAPLGARPEGWRFPARNRIIAALADVLVVVESHAAGGSLLTVKAAEERSVTVMAVPGSIRSPASIGTNRLLRDGCGPVCDTDDVLVALALETAGRPRPRPDTRPPPDPTEAAVLELLGWDAVGLDEVLAATDLPPLRVTVALAHLERDGWARSQGGWWERVAAP